MNLSKSARLFLAAFLVVISACHSNDTATNKYGANSPPKLPLDASHAEYDLALKKTYLYAAEDPDDADPENVKIEAWIAIGQRNLKWFDLINSVRPPNDLISMTEAGKHPFYSISSPFKYGFKSITTAWSDLETTMPAHLKETIFGNNELTTTFPGDVEELKTWALKVNDCYEDTVRYKSNKPWKDYYAREKYRDVRAYLELKGDPLLDQKLSQWATLDQDVKNDLAKKLIQICINADQNDDYAESMCTGMLSYETDLVKFKNQNMVGAEKNYQSFFKLAYERTDIQWNGSQPNVLSIPFVNPQNEKVFNYLKDNIEDEWKWEDWSLKLNFVETISPDTAHVIFAAGVTPFVGGDTWSEITMDSASPFSEYEFKHIIRHEFGHVLGFPDCYLEYYDPEQDVFTGYNLDEKDIMCSRSGHFLQRHLDELKRVYFKADE